MRQQYHAVQAEKGKYVWDVNRLIALIKNFPAIDVPLNDIAELDESYWYEEGGSKKPIVRDIALHAKLIYETNLDYPIILSASGRVMDGMHRCCKALILGHKTIKAVKFLQDPEPDYIDPDMASLPYEDSFKEVLEQFGLVDED